MSYMRYLDEAGLIVGILAALVGLYWQGQKARAEVGKARAEVEKIQYEMRPNGGASMRDAVNVLKANVSNLTESIDGVRADMRQDRDALRQDREALRQLHDDKTSDHSEIKSRLTRLEAYNDLHR